MAKIPKKVMLVEDYKDGCTIWRVPCDCMEPDHDIQLWFELDEEKRYGTVNLQTQLGWYPRYHDTWFKRVKRRVGAAMAILFQGHYTLTADVLLQRDGVEGLKFALTEGLKAMDAGEKQRERDEKLAAKNANKQE